MAHNLVLSQTDASRQLAGVVSIFGPAGVSVSKAADDASAPRLDGFDGTSVLEIASQLVADANKTGGGGAAASALLDGDAASAVVALNSLLAKSTFLAGPSSAEPAVLDALLFGLVHPIIRDSTPEQRSATNHVTRWFQHLQATAKNLQQDWLPAIDIDQQYIAPQKPAAASDNKAAAAGGKKAAAGGKKGGAAAAPAVSDAGKAKLIVGRMVSVEKHPNADSLYLEQIDLGEGQPRTIVSGLVSWYTPEQLLNRLVVVVANLPAADLKGVKSAGLVLCASNSDKSTVEVLDPPAGSSVGERVEIEGEAFAPKDEELTKNIFQRFLKPLQTNGDKVACWKDKVLKTAAGPVTVPTLAGAAIK